ncbi:MAG: flagellin [Caulobacterales bacterium]
MDRVATSTAYGTMLANLMASEVRQTIAGDQLSSTKVANDLKGFGANSETLVALQTTNNQVSGYLAQTQQIASKLSIQDQALNQVASAAQSASLSISNAIATGNGDLLMASLQNQFQSAVQGLNTTFNGEYIFSGGQVTTQPVSSTQLSDLTAGTIPGQFHNDQQQLTSNLDGSTTINSGFLADQVGTPLFTAFQSVEAYVQANGPFTGQLTPAQTAFLSGVVTSFNAADTQLNDTTGQNGQMQAQVTTAQSALTQRQTMLGGLISNITDVNLAQASTDLQQAQLSVQAAGQVFNSLKAASLLNTLTSTGIP